MPDALPLVTAALTGIAGSLATLVKDRGDKASTKKEIATIKAQLLELVDGLDRVKASLKRTRTTSGADSSTLELHRQIDELHVRVDSCIKRIDERDAQWATVQRELGAIDAKLEILMLQPR